MVFGKCLEIGNGIIRRNLIEYCVKHWRYQSCITPFSTWPGLHGYLNAQLPADVSIWVTAIFRLQVVEEHNVKTNQFFRGQPFRG